MTPGDTSPEPNDREPVASANVAMAANRISAFFIDLLYD
jgi:hypothetical protein